MKFISTLVEIVDNDRPHLCLDSKANAFVILNESSDEEQVIYDKLIDRVNKFEMKTKTFNELTHIDCNDVTNIKNYLDMDFSNFPVKEFREIACHGDEDINDVIVLRHDLGFQDDFGSFILVGIMGDELFDIEDKMNEVLTIRNSDVIKMTVPFDCWDESHHKESKLYNKLRSLIDTYKDSLNKVKDPIPTKNVDTDILSLKIAELEKQLDILKAAQAIVNNK